MRLIQLMISIFAVAGGLIALAIPIPNWKGRGMARPLTRHTSSVSSNKTIDLRDAIHSHGISVEEKILRGLDNYEMNTRTMHPFAVKRGESGLRTRGAVIPLTTYQNIMWSAEISIGTPPKSFKVHIDTGSADMWVLETGCAGISGNRELLDPHSSESAGKQAQPPFWLQYGDGTIIKGDRYTDNVTISGFTTDPQTFGSATSFISRELGRIEFPADGLLGLAFPSVSKFGVDPLFESLIKQKMLVNPTFSLKLSSSGAEMYVGGANSMLYNGNIAYTGVTDSGFWQVSMDDVRINGNPVLENVPTVFDTGANYIFGDWNQVSDMYAHIDGKVQKYNGYDYYHLPCDSFPAMSFTFGGRSFEIPPEVLKLQPVTEGSPNCFSAIVGRRATFGFWTIGLPFLQSVYTVFDYSTLQVGIAELV